MERLDFKTYEIKYVLMFFSTFELIRNPKIMQHKNRIISKIEFNVGNSTKVEPTVNPIIV